MTNSKPTMKLRFVEREETSQLSADGYYLPHDVVRVVKRRVLQQYWERDTYSVNLDAPGEWRDVPMATP